MSHRLQRRNVGLPSVLLVFAIVSLLSSATNAQLFFSSDSFEDLDFPPVTWVRTSGTADISNSGLEISNGTVRVGDENGNLVDYTDVILRTSVSVDDPDFFGGRSAAVFARASDDGRLGYAAGIDGINFAFIFSRDEPGADLRFLAIEDIPLNPKDTEVELEFGLEGNKLEFRVWKWGTPRPDAPLISTVDDRWETGPIGIRFGGNGTATFRSFSAVPEPVAGLLFLFGSLMAVSHCRKPTKGHGNEKHRIWP